jgi:hypothetical protein
MIVYTGSIRTKKLQMLLTPYSMNQSSRVQKYKCTSPYIMSASPSAHYVVDYFWPEVKLELVLVLVLIDQHRDSVFHLQRIPNIPSGNAEGRGMASLHTDLSLVQGVSVWSLVKDLDQSYSLENTTPRLQAFSCSSSSSKPYWPGPELLSGEYKPKVAGILLLLLFQSLLT